jgi:hypothetical protein
MVVLISQTNFLNDYNEYFGKTAKFRIIGVFLRIPSSTARRNSFSQGKPDALTFTSYKTGKKEAFLLLFSQYKAVHVQQAIE